MSGFYFYRSDRQLILVLLAIIAVLFVLLLCLGDSNSKEQPIVSAITTDTAATATRQEKTPQYYAVEPVKTELFNFDPNTADSTQLLRLGLQPWQVRNIYKYRAKGGIYRRPSDFARLYGLTVKQYRALEPYIKISADYMPASTLVSKEDTFTRDTLKYPVKITKNEKVILNLADTNQLKRVPGIGSWYARAIIRYGERLGGYANVGQLAEIDNFPVEAMDYLVVENPKIIRLNLNKLSLNELRRHPYISYYQAKAIVDYRRLYGPLNSLDDLKLNKYFSVEAIDRLLPYVEF